MMSLGSWNNDDEPIIINDEYAYRGNTHLISITYSHCGSGRLFYYTRAFRPVKQMSDSASEIGDGKDLSRELIYKVHRKTKFII